ncbi:MAG: cache domain-containing protein [Elusimicrobia bacterium]|nr:cache domain-containing protein [Elusimicrobiota bacterium]
MVKKFRDLGIRSKLLAGYITGFLLFLAIGGVTIYPIMQKTIEAGVESELTHTTDIILSMVRTTADASIKNYLRAVAEKDNDVVEQSYKLYRQGVLSEQDAKERAMAILLSQRIGQTGYVYCLDSKGVIRVHPKAALIGADLTRYGFIQEQLKRREGYVEYDWKNPGETSTRPKALYMTYFKPWDWIISASSYREEFGGLVKIEDFRDSLLAIRVGKTGYPYIIDSQGNVIVHPALTGNIYGVKDQRGREFVREILASKTGKVSYSWRDPGEQDYRQKLDIFSYIPELDWHVVSSSYLDEFYAPLKDIRRILVGLVLASVLFMFALTFLYSSYIVKNLNKLIRSLGAVGSGDYTARLPKVSADEFGRLTDFFNEFMEKLEKSRAALQQENQARKESERKYMELNLELEERVRQRTALAEQASQAKSDFLASMSHEIRTPLNAIVGMSELMDEAGLSKDQAQYLSIMRNASDTLLALINNILDISKIESGKVEIEAAPFNLEELVSKVSEMTAVRAYKKDVEISCKIDADVPVFLTGDSTRLGQVLTNLMGNAVKFVEKGHVSLNVKKQKTEGDKVELLFSLRDTGIGIPADKRASIFEKFTQADSSTTRKYGGTGLGLPISKLLIELMGGKIWLESEPGVGTVFYFTVRLSTQKDNRAVYLPKADIKELKGRRFLVVDDNLVNRIIIREIAQSWGAFCEGVAAGEAGLAKVLEEQLKGNPYHGIFVDFNMPGIDGYEFCRRLMQDPAITPKPALALVTSDTVRVKKEDFLALGVITHMMKPVKKQTVLEGALEMVALGKAAPAEAPQKATGYSRGDLPALAALVVDDSEDNRMLIGSFLKESKVKLDLAVDGFDALEKLKRGVYDIVFMDIQMPGMDGFEVTAKFRELEAAEKRARTKVVALTAMAMREDVDKALKAGCDDYLTKPIRKNAFYSYLIGFAAGRSGGA